MKSSGASTGSGQGSMPGSVVSEMNLPPSIRANLRFSYSESGPILYIHKSSRVKFKADFEAFLADAVNQQPAHTAAR